MTDEDIKLRSYQDDFAIDNVTDPVMDELASDDIESLGLPPEEVQTELDDIIDDEELIDEIDTQRANP